MPELRPYQQDVIGRVAAEMAAGRRRILLVAPTGAGKTVVAGALMADSVAQDQRVLFLAHRRELIQQASQKLYAVNVDHGIIQAGFPSRLAERVQVASVQTLHARAVRSSVIEMPQSDMVIVDEAHHGRAKTYQQIINAYPDAVLIGLTATPCRGDGRGLGNVFDVIVECASIGDLIKAGYLVPTKVYAPSRPDLKGVRVQHGDYVEADLAQRMDTQTLTGDIVTHWFKLAERRRTVVFATTVAHSVHLRDEFLRAGVLAEHIDGQMPLDERDRVLAKLAAGQIELVVNCAVLTEGWDSPEVSCIVLARPTKSLGLYRQMVGRVLRPAPGKTDALVIDHAGAVFEHGFVEEPVTWTLEEDKKAENKTQTARAKTRMAALTTCPECHAVRMEGKPCGSCGWRPKAKPQAVDIADGELAQVLRDKSITPQQYPVAARLEFYRQLVYIANERGYSQGWAYHKYIERFDAKPLWEWRKARPMTPAAEVRSWIRSRQIAWAKSRDNETRATA